MGDILNINGVDICTNILDLDTVLQTNIVNVNSVTINCGYSGNSWDCSATTISDSCSGATQVSPSSESAMSLHFSDYGANQGLVTTDYYYLDITTTPASTTCIEKSLPKRQLLGWALENNGDALYASVGGGIHTGWSTFISNLNASGIIGLPTSTLAANLTSVLSSLGPPASSYIAVFKDCKCIYDCNCVAISGSSGAYSSMTQCLEDDKTCCAECKVNTAISLAMHDATCEEACEGVCYTYFTDVIAPIPCPMSVGDHLYIDTECTPASRGFYSPNNCDSMCGYCYEVGALGEIITVTLCDEEKCNVVVLHTDPWGNPCPAGNECDDGDCNVCELSNPIFPYTDALGSPPNLQVGDHIYPFSDCICQSDHVLNLASGMYRWKYTVTNDYWCITIIEGCEISKKTFCDEVLPDGPGPDGDGDSDGDDDKTWIVDEETGYKYYDEDGYRYYDTDDDGEADYSEPIKDDDGPEEVV